MKTDLLKYWSLTADELSEIISASPSLRGMMAGYVAEHKLKDFLMESGKVVGNIGKYDDHDREKRGDLFIVYKGKKVGIEVKSLQTNSIKETDGKFKARFQCDASDRREVELPNGNKIETTCLVAGEFDLLAVNLFAFHEKWEFAFAKNLDLPRTAHSKYTPEQRKYLLATLMEITWPLQPPFQSDPFPLPNEIAQTS
ncbi:MAG: restriction endonuclease [Candidatus Bathyarchaeia archaeon]